MIPGQRFELDIGSDDEERGAQQSNAKVPLNFVGDVLERKPDAAASPSAPSLKSKTGFPEHKKRTIGSRFKQQNAAPQTQSTPKNTTSSTANVGSERLYHDGTQVGTRAKSWQEEEKAQIDLENRQRLAEMSSEEIGAERAELMSSLSPAFIQKLLARSNIDSGSSETDLSNPHKHGATSAEPGVGQKESTTVKFEELEDRDGEHAHQMTGNPMQSVELDTLPHDSVHFPRPHQPPSLDPNSATFLDDLHEKYFPSLPTDPDKLQWMQDSAPAKSRYDGSAAALNPNEIRFAFSGQLIPPKMASEIPVTSGLHHHGDAPEAAGYTIPEMALLSRSSYAAQRCIAFQTLGRVLYRLGKGEFGDPGEAGANTVGAEDTFGELARGLWREIDKEHVIDVLVAESEGSGVDRGRHLSAKAYATEAVWLWRKGGGRRWKAE